MIRKLFEDYFLKISKKLKYFLIEILRAMLSLIKQGICVIMRGISFRLVSMFSHECKRVKYLNKGPQQVSVMYNANRNNIIEYQLPLNFV